MKIKGFYKRFPFIQAVLFSLLFSGLMGCNGYSFYQELGEAIPENANLPKLGLTIQPESTLVYIGEKVYFSATGGVQPYKYSIVDCADGINCGTIDEDTGIYTAPLTVPSDSVKVRVTDAESSTSEAVVTIVDYPSISTYPDSMKVYETFTFDASGGIEPYSYEIGSGGGTIDPETGLYEAPGYSDTVTVIVKDSSGRPDEYTFSVSWHRKVVDSSTQVGKYSSLSVTSTGNPRIAYYDESNGDLKYAYSDDYGETWTIETADSSVNDVGQYCSLAVDGSDFPHISYYDSSNQDLLYKYQDSSGWTVTNNIGGSGGSKGLYSSIVFDSSSHGYISYQFNTNLYCYNLTTAIETLVDNNGGTGGTGYFTSIKVNHVSGYPGISYRNDTNNELCYAYYDGSSWQTETLLTGDTGYYTSLAFDSSGNPHISFYDKDNQAVEYISYSSGAWETTPEIVDDTVGDCVTGVYGATSLAIDSNDIPHIVYYNADKTALMYAFKESDGTWHKDTIQSSGDVGQYASIVIYHKNGRERVACSYYDATNKYLKFAY